MSDVNFGKVSGTVVDVCRGNGTFLDTGELHQIAEFIQAAVRRSDYGDVFGSNVNATPLMQ